MKLNSAILALTVLTVGASAQTTVDPAVPAYEPVSGVSGNLNAIGSDTLNNLMSLWAEGFKAKYPNVNIQIDGKGSATAPPALIDGVSQLGPMSREMKQEEIDQFEAKFGYKPTLVRVAIDALAVYANKENPVKGLTLKQLDGIFSSTLKRGGEDVKTWDQVGVEEYKGRDISAYGRNSASGTYAFFKEHVLEKGDYKATVKEQPGSSAVVQGVGSDQYGIGYSGVGYKTDAVKFVPLGETDGEYVQPDYEHCLDGSYPLARFLLIYVNKKPGEKLDTLTDEFLKFILSQEGQAVVAKDGYFPLPAELVQENRKTVE